jgi:cytosine/adenosine deaminase-related metal-dependent hydrolase
MHWKWIGALGAVLALAAGGCGSSSKSVTRLDFAKRANAVCAHMRAQGISTVKDASSRKRAQDLSDAQIRARFGPVMAALQRRQLAQIEALDPPAALQGAFVKWRKLLGEQIERGLGPVHPTAADHTAAIALSQQLEQTTAKLGITELCL